MNFWEALFTDSRYDSMKPKWRVEFDKNIERISYLTELDERELRRVADTLEKLNIIRV